MLFFVKKYKLFSCSRTISILSPSSSSSSHQLIKTLLSFSTTAAATKSTKTEQTLFPNSDFNIVNYLINSCGLSSQQALKASKNIAHIESPKKPDSVISFLKDYGFGDADITRVILDDPMILCKRIETTLKPKIRILEDMGFSSMEMVKLVTTKPSILRVSSRSKVESLRDIFGSNKNLLKASGKCTYLFTSSLSDKVLPNASMLRNCGISNRQLVSLISARPSLLARSVDSVKVVIKRVEALGIPPGTNTFLQALVSISSTSEATLKSKLQMWKSFGLSEAEALSAISKYPVIIRLSEEKVRGTIAFLMKDAGCSISYIASHGQLFTFSLKSRLIPRVYVLKIVNLLSERILCSAMNMKTEKFLEKFVLPHKELLPELEEFYISACSGNFAD